jgi:hypothetical protein
VVIRSQKIKLLVVASTLSLAILLCLSTRIAYDLITWLGRDNYKEAVFVVESARRVYAEDGPELVAYGTIGGIAEEYPLGQVLHGVSCSQEELTRRVPPGTRFEVLYNPKAYRNLWLEDRTLRVIPREGGQVKHLCGLLRIVVAPLAIYLTLLLPYLLIRWIVGRFAT